MSEQVQYKDKVEQRIEKCLKLKIVRQCVQYAKDVVEGKEVAPWEVIKQCEMFIEDWEVNQYKEEWGFMFSYKHMRKIAKIIKLMKFATGYVAGQSIYDHLSPYQAFFIVNIFGWRYKKEKCQFKHSDITLFVARKNAKVLAL